MIFEEDSDLVLDATKNYLIYFLLKDKEVVYVGQTTQNVMRPFAHKDKIFDSVAIIYQAEDRENLNEVEEFFIKKYCPKYNKTFNAENYANEIITDVTEIETLKSFSKYFMTREQINERLKENGLYVLSKKEYKLLQYQGFIVDNKLTLMDPKSLLKLMKTRVLPPQKRKSRKQKKYDFDKFIEDVLEKAKNGK